METRVYFAKSSKLEFPKKARIVQTLASIKYVRTEGEGIKEVISYAMKRGNL